MASDSSGLSSWFDITRRRQRKMRSGDDFRGHIRQRVGGTINCGRPTEVPSTRLRSTRRCFGRSSMTPSRRASPHLLRSGPRQRTMSSPAMKSSTRTSLPLCPLETHWTVSALLTSFPHQRRASTESPSVSSLTSGNPLVGSHKRATTPTLNLPSQLSSPSSNPN